MKTEKLDTSRANIESYLARTPSEKVTSVYLYALLDERDELEAALIQAHSKSLRY